MSENGRYQTNLGDVQGVQLSADIQSIVEIGGALTKQPKLGWSSSSCGNWSPSSRRSGCVSSGWLSSSSWLTTTQLLSSEARWLGTLRTGTLAMRLLDRDADLALVEELGTVRVLVNVGFLTSHQIGRVLQVVEKELVESTPFFVQDLDSVAVPVVDSARMNNGAESIGGLAVTSPLNSSVQSAHQLRKYLVIDLLADGGELDGLAGWTSFEDLNSFELDTSRSCSSYLVLADRHGNNLSLEGCCEFGDLQLSADSLVGLHVEALDSVGTIDLGHELWMERDDDSCGDKHSLRVQGTSSSNVAGVKRQLDSRNLAPVLIRSTSLLVEQPLD